MLKHDETITKLDFYERQFETIFAKEMNLILNSLWEENSNGWGYYEISTGKHSKQINCKLLSRFSSKDNVIFETNDMINFDIKNKFDRNKLDQVLKTFCFDGRILTWTNDKNLNQKVLDLIGKDFVYQRWDDPNYQALLKLNLENCKTEKEIEDLITKWKKQNGLNKTKKVK